MDIQTFLKNIITFLNETIVPFIIAAAFLVFIWNMARYFIIGSTVAGDEKKGVVSGRIRARQYALYSIIAFVVILSLWGIVNMFVDGFGFGAEQQITPDYMNSGGAGSSGGSTPSGDSDDCIGHDYSQGPC